MRLRQKKGQDTIVIAIAPHPLLEAGAYGPGGAN
jgi:hypothetical protein